MSLRYGLAQGLGRLAQLILKRLGRGSSLPGKLALEIDPRFLAHAAPAQTICVTGTNGKTMTTRLMVAALEEAGVPVRTNGGGANMKQGLATALLGRKRRGEVCVLEVDEATMPLVAKDLQAKMVVLTNLFQDQSERYASPKVTLGLLQNALADLPQARLVFHGEVPLFHPASLGREGLAYGLGSRALAPTEGKAAQGQCPVCDGPLTYEKYAYADIGAYHCPACGLESPDLDVALDGPPNLAMEGSTFSIEGQDFSLPAAGLYNVVNALGAYTACQAMGLPSHVMAEAFRKVGAVGGRQETVTVKGKQATLHLMKNPVGFDQIVELLRLERQPFGLVLVLNDRPADGMDISWIQAADFPGLLALSDGQAMVGGLRGQDLYDHLRNQGGRDMVGFDSFDDLETLMAATDLDRFHILLTYTALGDFRAWLKGKGAKK